MKIYYKQPDQDRQTSLGRFGIQNCYFKKLSYDQDNKNVTLKPHHHTGFEIHFIIEGFQQYEVDGKSYTIENGGVLIIYPNVSHTIVSSAPYTQKYSITFDMYTAKSQKDFFCEITERIAGNLDYISSEALLKRESSATLIENSIFEIIVWALRMSGMEENKSTNNPDENVVVSLAKRYIDDNIEMAPSVLEVAKHCYLSAKQLTRIFHKFEGVSPGEYIISSRIVKIKELLEDNLISLKQISEIMNFNNEYYFNSYFKKYSGMPPGEYRKMLGK